MNSYIGWLGELQNYASWSLLQFSMLHQTQIETSRTKKPSRADVGTKVAAWCIKVRFLPNLQPNSRSAEHKKQNYNGPTDLRLGSFVQGDSFFAVYTVTASLPWASRPQVNLPTRLQLPCKCSTPCISKTKAWRTRKKWQERLVVSTRLSRLFTQTHLVQPEFAVVTKEQS